MLKKQDILDRTDGGLEVFRHYIQGNWQVGKNFKNPLYEDKNASCNIYKDVKNNCYKMKDFGNDFFSGDCFFLVGYLNGLDCRNSLDFIEILKIINRDLSLGLDKDNFTKGFFRNENKKDTNPQKSLQPQITNDTPAINSSFFTEEATPSLLTYQFETKNFTEKELAFWSKSGISLGFRELSSGFFTKVFIGKPKRKTIRFQKYAFYMQVMYRNIVLVKNTCHCKAICFSLHREKKTY